MASCFKYKVLHPAIAVVLLCLWSWHPVFALDQSKEYTLKAAFLTNFVRFITWPDQENSGSNQDIVICIVGENPFGGALRGVEGKLFNKRKLRVVEAASVHSIPDCHLLFVSKAAVPQLQQVMTQITNKPVVSVSDMAGFVDSGGGIEFVTVKQDRLSFIINRTNLTERNIKIRSQMLDLALALH